jgi:thioredoxin reductase (NADPH)
MAQPAMLVVTDDSKVLARLRQLKPWDPAEEYLYLPVGEQLIEWARTTGVPGFVVWRIVGRHRSPRSHELRDLLDRNAIPYQFHPHDSEAGRELLRETGQDGSRLPVLVLFDGRALVDPTNAEVAAAIGVATRPEPGRYDLIVVGAGPAGLSAATYGASEGLRTALLEPEALGGQAGTSSLIRNYLGFPRGVSGRTLAQRAAEQASLFGAELVYARAVGLRPAEQDRVVTLADGGEAVGRAVVIATGAAYRRLDAPGVDELLGTGVFYGAAVSEARATAGREVFVVGAGNSAGQAAIHLAKYAARVTILARGDTLRRTMSDYLVRQIEADDTITVRLRTEVVGAAGAGQLDRLVLRRRHRSQRAGAGGGAVHPDRCPAPDGLAGRGGGTRRSRVRVDRPRPGPGRAAAAGLAAGAPAHAAGDQPPRGVRRR